MAPYSIYCNKQKLVDYCVFFKIIIFYLFSALYKRVFLISAFPQITLNIENIKFLLNSKDIFENVHSCVSLFARMQQTV